MVGDTTPMKGGEPPIVPQRVIKRYSNRKLYDTRDSRYVTLLQVAEFVRAGEDVQVIDNGTKEDKTDVTLALIISEELKARPRGIPLATLKALIRSRGGRILNQLKDSPIGKLMPKEGAESHQTAVSEAAPAVRGVRGTFEHWQQVVDDRIRAALPTFTAYRDLESQVKRLSVRLDNLERRLSDPPRQSNDD